MSAMELKSTRPTPEPICTAEDEAELEIIAKQAMPEVAKPAIPSPLSKMRRCLQKGREECQCHLNIWAIDLDPVKHRVEMKFSAQFSFRDAGFAMDQFDPKIVFPDLLEELSREEWADEGQKTGRHYVSYKMEFRGIFAMHYEFQRFPFDLQKLTLRISSSYLSSELELVDNGLTMMNASAFQTLKDQWQFATHSEDDEVAVLVVPSKTTEAHRSSTGCRYPLIEVEIMCVRFPTYYMVNLFLPTFMITSLAFFSFALEIDDSADRLGLSLTLFLTLVAFKQSMSADIPHCGYLSLIDTYLVAAMITVCAIVAAQGSVAVEKRLGNAWVQSLSELDETLIFAILSFWILCNVVVFGLALVTYCHNTHDMKTFLQRHKKSRKGTRGGFANCFAHTEGQRIHQRSSSGRQADAAEHPFGVPSGGHTPASPGNEQWPHSGASAYSWGSFRSGPQLWR